MILVIDSYENNITLITTSHFNKLQKMFYAPSVALQKNETRIYNGI